MKKVRRLESGFSAVEMLITIVVIGLVFTAFVTTFVTLSAISLKGKQVTIANTTAYAKLQDYENADFTSLPATTVGAPTATQVEDFSNSLPVTLSAPRVGVVEIRAINATLKQINVRITYGSGGAQRIIEYHDFINKDGVGR